MKALLLTSVLFVTASSAMAQNIPSNQESGDIFQSCVRLNQPNSATTLSSPFNMGFVNTPTSALLSVAFQAYPGGQNGYPYYPDIFTATEANGFVSSAVSLSIIAIDFSSGDTFSYPGLNFFANPNTVTMGATDVIPCIETQLPKGTYTFQASATPPAGSTTGTFEFATYTAGIWTVQFNLALPKPEGATRTLTFAHDTKVRWMLINTPGTSACAAINARYYNSGN